MNNCTVYLGAGGGGACRKRDNENAVVIGFELQLNTRSTTYATEESIPLADFENVQYHS